jgi:hypothetical protein
VFFGRFAHRNLRSRQRWNFDDMGTFVHAIGSARWRIDGFIGKRARVMSALDAARHFRIAVFVRYECPMAPIESLEFASLASERELGRTIVQSL